MRWARRPWRRSNRRIHSSVIGGSRPRWRQYAAGSGTVHADLQRAQQLLTVDSLLNTN
jgi:hypothetical protein